MSHIVEHDSPPQSRLLAKLVRGLLARESFETLADLTAALKGECARLRIRWTPEAITEAYRVIASNTPLLVQAPPVTRTPEPPRAEVRPLSRDDAWAALTRVFAHLDGGSDAHR